MARKQGSGGARRKFSGRGLRPFLWLLLFTGAAAGGFYAAQQVLRLDATVVERFSGRLFRVPSRVLSAPMLLHPGMNWRQAGLRETLLRLGYRERSESGEAGARIASFIASDAATVNVAELSPSSLPPGYFHWGRGFVTLHRRAFSHPSRAEPARRIALQMQDEYIDAIHNQDSGRPVPLLYLEPESIGAYYGPGAHEQRELIKLSQAPQVLVDAVLASEDQRFHAHRGLDLRRIAAAALTNLRAGGVRQGASTLTQQLAKNFFLTPDRSLERKIKEALMALLMEARYSKEQILEAYLNEIYWGQRGSTEIHGVGEAARFYFNKPVRALQAHEAALLAGLIPSPNRYSPHRHPQRAQKRRDLVLGQMHRWRKLSAEEYESALAEELGVADATGEPRQARHFMDVLRRQLPAAYGEDILAAGGLQIYSTLDVRLQHTAATALREELAALEEKYPKLAPKEAAQLEGCLLALQPQTGEVLALVGGRDYGQSQFDRCTQARRPAGSVFKPFVYAAALQNGTINLGATLDDSEFSLPVPGGNWEPENFDEEFHGRAVPVRTALEKSYNVAAARLAQQVGLPRVVAMARALGIESPLEQVPSLAIGAADLTPLELARAYATFANGGIRPQIVSFADVVDPEGGAVQRASRSRALRGLPPPRALDAGTAYLVVSLLEGAARRGTAAGLRREIQGAVAAKTGTSNDNKDAWLVGFTPELVVAVWVGFDAPHDLGLPSSQIALPVWRRFVRDVTGGNVPFEFARPQEVVELEIHPDTGALALAGCPARRKELFVRGREPARTCPEWGRRPAADSGFESDSASDENGEEAQPTQSELRSFFENLFRRSG